MARLLADYNAGYIELHFLTEDGSHSMSAEALNKCVYEYLGIIREISTKFKVELFLESEALKEGGVRHWLKVGLPTKEEFKKEVILQIMVLLVTTPFVATCSSLVSHVVEQILTPSEILRLQQEKTKAELEYQIAWYRNESSKLADTINTDMVAKKASNFPDFINASPI